MIRQPRNATNRLLLGATGLVLLAAGVWTATASDRLAARMPSWWPLPHDPLLDRTRMTELRDHSWWTPTVMAVGAVVTVGLILWWLAQLAVRRPSRLALAAPDSHLHSTALADTLSRRAETIDGVTRSRARLARHRGRIHVQLQVRIEPGSNPRTVLQHVNNLISEAQAAAVPHDLTVQVRVHSTHHRAAHVH
ncbi:hypothetical protein G3I40_30505 [Streptomyces sp. SID14478]|uniref:hypothetical protein n=1 Tax=Streptomyces sp. SID14478 TaxID=2706073 RepID=UPI0013D95773|nr:hypothetical protein [Streptomyces sp. SID14478]NEB79517.1 hypothetical protein [Streptomyces sp. SID14478]